VEVALETGVCGCGAVPSGASTGSHEATELRDKDVERFSGMGVLRAIEAVNGEIFDALSGQDVEDQTTIDNLMIELDGTTSKSRLGANAILAVSLAVARTASAQANLPLYKYIGGVNARILPVPMMNIINGGVHADNSLDIQEFMIIPVGAPNFSEGVRWGAEIFFALKSRLKTAGHSTAVGDEGGFAPNLTSNAHALLELVQSIEAAGFRPGVDVSLSLDVAATELLNENVYFLKGENQKYTSEKLIDYLEKLTKEFPISSIEDGLAEDDWNGWSALTRRLGDKVQLVGDDLFVTNQKRLQMGIAKNAANAILIKMNQIGTISETLDSIETAHRAGYRTIVSHRSGETEDTSIADLSVAVNCGQIKVGSLSRTDRVAKYNQLLRIEEELGKNAVYGIAEGSLNHEIE
tara:strand:+ start:273 stop:1496 length:1224 start_codon:yes stop_codon:yes gene_type:complete